jgi:hypothetical protein
VVADDGTVHGVIVCNNWCAGRTLPGYMGCSNGCRLVVQGQQTADGNVAGWHGPDVKYDDGAKKFTLPGGGSITAGAKMEEAVFPTTTTSIVVTTTDVVSVETVDEPENGDGAESAPARIATPSSSSVQPVPEGEVVAVVDGEEVASASSSVVGADDVLVGDFTADISPVDGESSESDATDDAVYAPGDPVALSASGLQPHSTVDVTIHSEPRKLGEIRADGSGYLRALVQIPGDMPAGNHTVVLRGTNRQGVPVEMRFGVVVVDVTSGSFDVVPLAIGLLSVTILLAWRSGVGRKRLLL